MTKRSIGNANPKAITFTIPGPLPSLNRLLQIHWAKRDRLKNDYAWQFIAGVGCRGDFQRRKRIVSIIIYQPYRRFDEDNAIGATKLLVDALRQAGFIYQDSPHWLERRISQEIDRKNPRVEITVEET